MLRLALFVTLPFLGLVSCRGERPPFNVLFISVDTLRADHLGCYGYERDTSPAIDRLASRSVRFDQALVQWPKTGPSICSIFTSTYGSTSGVLRSTGKIPVPQDHDVLAERLAEAGYETLAVVTNNCLSAQLGYDQGFNFFESVESQIGDFVTARALAVIRARKTTHPFFLWVHYLDPHASYRPPEKYADLFLDDELYRADTREPVPVATDPMTHGIGHIPLNAFHEGLDRVRDYVALYDSEIRFLDECVGELLDEMETDGLLENTLIVLTSDHGESLGDHAYYFRHGMLPYDDCVRVPLLIHVPGLRSGVIQEPTALLDLTPTILEALGVERAWQCEGSSVLSWLREGEARSPRPVFTESGVEENYAISVRKGRYKLIRYGDQRIKRRVDAQLGRRRSRRGGSPDGAPYELYDIHADPGETRDLFSRRPEIVEELRELLDPFVEQSYARAPSRGEGEIRISEEMAETLKELGYVEDG